MYIDIKRKVHIFFCWKYTVLIYNHSNQRTVYSPKYHFHYNSMIQISGIIIYIDRKRKVHIFVGNTLYL